MLQISNLTFAYSNCEIFNQINLTLSNAEKVAIIGDNGTGKTTLLELLAGQLAPDTGSLRLDGKVGYLPQTPETNTDKSGGERTRLALTKLFAQDFDVLLLDEPTNNLDASARQWLLTQLRHFPGLVLIVSHDRAFINDVAEAIIEIKNHQLQLFHGNYSDFLTRNQQLRNQQLRNYEQAQRAKRHLHQQISRAYNDNNRVSQLHFNKIRDENKMAFHGRKNHAQNTASRIINTAQTKLAHLEGIEKPQQRKTYQAKISADFLRQRRLLKIQELTKSFGSKILFQNLNLEISTSERVQIVGDNGTGKTTLFKIILKELEPDSGTVTLAPNLRLGYISQDISGLELTQNFLSQVDAPVTEVFQAATTMDLTKAELTVPVQTLSRGQIAKLALLKIILQPVDLLILDEPTNHLDIRARGNIEQALQAYAGAILFATHDATFAEKLHPERIIELGQES